ncbi:MAG: hypothetical protein PHF21_02555 [Bacilli bacterium]|nr:hypothetical protein [Bacilli bacterium]
MKDYSLNIKEQTNFIKNYTIKKGEIVSKLPYGKKHYIPYSEKNEARVLTIMENQLKNLDKKDKIFRRKHHLNLLNTIIFGILTYLGFTNLYIAEINQYLPMIIQIIAGGGSLISAIKTIKTHGIIKDIEKTKYYKNNEFELNKNIKENENMKLNLSNKKIDIINNTPDNKNVFDINKIDIDNWTLEELKNVKNNIEREYYFAFNYETQDELENDAPILKYSNKKTKK